ncbi:MAG: response regulator, partial [Anaerolineae bacterium]|nr:response regulator [Anaerolineae bacterium]
MTNPTYSPLVLVADDEINTTIMLQHIFERDGYRVERVSDGYAAIETAKQILPDLILLDIRMPRLDGFEVLRLLRADEQTMSIPTIVITANATAPADVERGLNLGADDYLEKPFAPQELLARARSKIRARQLEDALHRRTQQLEALLSISEQFNQHLEISDLLTLIVSLVLERLPGDVAMIHLLDERGQIIDSRAYDRFGEPITPVDQRFIAQGVRSSEALLWEGSKLPINGFASGITSPLRHGETLMGMLTLFSRSTVYDDNNLRLFNGITTQAALALHNAELYQI